MGTRTKGSSLRQRLITQGVTDEKEIQSHLDRAYAVTKILPTVRTNLYNPRIRKGKQA